MTARTLVTALLALALPGCLAPDATPAATPNVIEKNAPPGPFQAEGVLWPTQPQEYEIPFPVNASGMRVVAELRAGTRVLVELPPWVQVRVELRDPEGRVVDEATLRMDHGYEATLEHVAAAAGEHVLHVAYDGGGDGAGRGDYLAYALDAR